MNENCDKKVIIFDMEGTLVHEHESLAWTERLLRVLSGAGLKLAVLTDLSEQKGKAILAEAGIDAGIFDMFISTTHYDEAVKSAAEKFGAECGGIIFCTGSAVGIKIASRCGTVPVAARTHFTKEFYVKAGAAHVCGDLMELTDILGIAE